jgi:hypothetical protein
MTKSKPIETPSAALPAKGPPATKPRALLSPWTKLLISVLLLVHLAAVITPPLAFGARFSSPLLEPISRLLAPYCSAMYLNHGYAFFAPNPGPNHLVDYTVEFKDGRPAVTGRFPNLREERPRLLYHRHFMLSESLNTRFAPDTFDPEPSPPPLTATAGERERFAVVKRDYERAKARWQHARKQYEAMQASIKAHLKHVHGGDEVKIARIEHLPADPDAVMYERRSLADPASYRELPEKLPTGATR